MPPAPHARWTSTAAMTLDLPPLTPPAKRSLSIDGHATSVSLEEAFWRAAQQAAAAALSLEEQAQLLRDAVATFRTDALVELAAAAAPAAVSAPAVRSQIRPEKTTVVPSVARALASRKAAKPAASTELVPEQAPAAVHEQKAPQEAHSAVAPVAAAVAAAAVSEAVLAPALKLSTGSADEDDWSTF